MWNSVVDPARVNTTEPMPTFEADGITVTIDIVAWTPTTAVGEFAGMCMEEAVFEEDFSGEPLGISCVYMQWRMSVAADFEVDGNSPEAGMSADALITPEGRQVDSIWAASAYPGTVDTTLSVYFVHGVPGSTVKFQSGSNLVGWTTHTYVVPPIEQLLPLEWALEVA